MDVVVTVFLYRGRYVNVLRNTNSEFKSESGLCKSEYSELASPSTVLTRSYDLRVV